MDSGLRRNDEFEAVGKSSYIRRISFLLKMPFRREAAMSGDS